MPDPDRDLMAELGRFLECTSACICNHRARRAQVVFSSHAMFPQDPNVFGPKRLLEIIQLPIHEALWRKERWS